MSGRILVRPLGVFASLARKNVMSCAMMCNAPYDGFGSVFDSVIATMVA